MHPEKSLSFQQLTLNENDTKSKSSRSNKRTVLPPLKKRVTDSDLSAETRMLIKRIYKELLIVRNDENIETDVYATSN
jgi:hypothetical protein